MHAGLLPSSLAEHFDHQAITFNYMMMNKNQSCYSRKYETICVVHFFTACIDGTPQAIWWSMVSRWELDSFFPKTNELRKRSVGSFICRLSYAYFGESAIFFTIYLRYKGGLTAKFKASLSKHRRYFCLASCLCLQPSRLPRWIDRLCGGDSQLGCCFFWWWYCRFCLCAFDFLWLKSSTTSQPDRRKPWALLRLYLLVIAAASFFICFDGRSKP